MSGALRIATRRTDFRLEPADSQATAVAPAVFVPVMNVTSSSLEVIWGFLERYLPDILGSHCLQHLATPFSVRIESPRSKWSTYFRNGF